MGKIPLSIIMNSSCGKNPFCRDQVVFFELMGMIELLDSWVFDDFII